MRNYQITIYMLVQSKKLIMKHHHLKILLEVV